MSAFKSILVLLVLVIGVVACSPALPEFGPVVYYVLSLIFFLAGLFPANPALPGEDEAGLAGRIQRALEEGDCIVLSLRDEIAQALEEEAVVEKAAAEKAAALALRGKLEGLRAQGQGAGPKTVRETGVSAAAGHGLMVRLCQDEIMAALKSGDRVGFAYWCEQKRSFK